LTSLDIRPLIERLEGRGAISRVECPRCRNLIDARATRCQYCHVDFNEADLAALQQSAAARQRRTAVVVSAVIVIFLLVIAIGQCGPRPAPNGSSPDSEPPSVNALASVPATDETLPGTDAPPAAPVGEPPSQWTYSRTHDELRNGDVVTARIRSTNSTNLDFPYGTVHLNITVRRHPEWGLDVIFAVDEGQILCRIRDCSGTISFDGAPERLSLNESADNESSVVFAQYPEAVLRKLRDSDRVIVELPFFQNGNRQFTFDTRGLDWPPPD
jgi:hypothetical protein